MKTKLLLIILLALTLCLTACGGGEQPPAAAPADEPAAPVDEPAAGSGGEAQYKLRLASNLPLADLNCGAVEEMIAKISEQTNGAIEISFYPASQLGEYPLVYEEVMRGTIDMAVGTIPATYDARMEMHYIPYLLTNHEDMMNLYVPGATLYDAMEAIHAELGVTLLGEVACGFMSVGFTEYPTDAYADPSVDKNLLVRVPDATEIFRLIVEDLGFMTTNIAYGDIYTSMQTGVCEGTSATPNMGMYFEFRDVITHHVDYNYLMEDMGIIINADLLAGMPAEYQDIIKECAMELSLKSFELAKEMDESALDSMEEYGITVLRLTDEEREAIAASARANIWPLLEEQFGADFMAGIHKDLGL